MTMEIIADPAPGSSDTLLVLLPGAAMRAADYRANGFFAAVRRRLPVDIVAVETGIECYLDEVVAERIATEVLAPARARGIARLWLAGISLGGFGALLSAQARPDLVDGILLLAPFLGSRGLIAAVEQAGGLREWQPTPENLATPEGRLLAWLQHYRPDAAGYPDIRLAFGKDDRFAAAHALLGEVLPAEKVVTGPGDHDWETWTGLWERLLEMTGVLA